MARQQTSPVTFNRTTRRDRSITMTSGRAGKVVPVAYFPVLNGDAGSGRVGIDIELGEMPRPLLNGVFANVQAWLVPKCAHPQFAGYDDYMHARLGTDIKTLGAADRTPPAFFTTLTGADLTTVANSELFKALGVHLSSGQDINTDLIDAFNLIYNFRLAAHSSKLTRREYASENLANSVALPRAFWPKSAMTRVVPDYEQALVKGSLDLDVSAGRLPMSGMALVNNSPTGAPTSPADTHDGLGADAAGSNWVDVSGSNRLYVEHDNANPDILQVFAEMSGQSISTTLADIDKARTTQAFAKLRQSYAGNDATGFDNDDTLVAMLMSGFRVPEDNFKRPILLDNRVVPFGFTERFATDGASLDDSVSQGRASAVLSLNIPQMICEGTVIVTVEVLPELLQEAMSDEWINATEVADLPDALRDVQRTEPVDQVLNRRRDARHTTPNGLYGYEPMNDVWNRNYTRLGGAFKQDDPANPFTEQRAALWLAGIVNPGFTSDHWLAPASFPHDVFSDTLADAFECVVRHDVTINGLTQIGDVLEEDNSNFNAVGGA